MRILHVVSALDGAGVPNFLLSYRSELDPKEFAFDFVVHGDDIGVQEALFKSMGAKVYHVKPRRESLYTNLRGIAQVLRAGDYDVVHCHLNYSSVFPLAIAAALRVPVRISHAHGSFEASSIWEKAWHTLASKAIPMLATELFSCSENSGKWLYRDSWRGGARRSFVMKNAVDPALIQDNASALPADFVPPELGTRTLVALGRLSSDKNHAFLFPVLQSLIADGGKYRLLLLGDGPLRNELEKEVSRRGISEYVEFLGYRADALAWLRLADINLLPSIREGLPVSLVEAQALGTPSIVSAHVTEEADITGAIQFVKLDTERWVSAIREVSGHDSRPVGDAFDATGYEIGAAARAYRRYMAQPDEANL